MYKGTVKIFNHSKGIGYIIDALSAQEIFVHVTGLIDQIREGDTVTYNLARGKKSINAVDVRLA